MQADNYQPAQVTIDEIEKNLEEFRARLEAEMELVLVHDGIPVARFLPAQSCSLGKNSS